jgi:O-acetyl-ADP-ribose deacetylase
VSSDAGRIEVVQGDITRLRVDVIVNAANSSLLGGGGVDGAIHRAAGPELVEECRKLGRCKTGDAVMTRAYRLPARHVVHTVGPVWQGGRHGERRLLASCYRRSLELAAQAGARTIAFPMISTGAFGYPIAQAATVAVSSVRRWLEANERPELVVLCTFSEEATTAVRDALGVLEHDHDTHVPDSTQVDVRCPYCGELTSISLDERGGRSVEDCTICCRPIDVLAIVDGDGDSSVRVQRQDA